jgi:hypothetical protein
MALHSQQPEVHSQQPHTLMQPHNQQPEAHLHLIEALAVAVLEGDDMLCR